MAARELEREFVINFSISFLRVQSEFLSLSLSLSFVFLAPQAPRF